MKSISNFYLFGLIILLIIACQSKPASIESNKYQQKYVVTFHTLIEDSICHDKTVECFAYVDLKDSICNWRKVFFYREYENLNSAGVAYTIDSLDIKFKLNTNFEIEKILNWHQLYSRVKNEVDKMMVGVAEERKEMLSEFLNKISLDSANIVNKNTNEIQVFNLGLKFLYNESSIDESIYTIKKSKNSTSIVANDVEMGSYSFDEIRNLIPINHLANDPISYKFNVEIIIDEKSKLITFLKYTVFSADAGVKYSNSATITLLKE